MALEVIGAAAIINGTIHREVNDWIRRPWEPENNNLCQRQNEPTVLFADCKKFFIERQVTDFHLLTAACCAAFHFFGFLTCLHWGRIISSSRAFSKSLFNMLMPRCTLRLIFTVLRSLWSKFHFTLLYLISSQDDNGVIPSIRTLHCTNTAYLISVSIKSNQWSAVSSCTQGSISCPCKDCGQGVLLTRDSTPALIIDRRHKSQQCNKRPQTWPSTK